MGSFIVYTLHAENKPLDLKFRVKMCLEEPDEVNPEKEFFEGYAFSIEELVDLSSDTPDVLDTRKYWTVPLDKMRKFYQYHRNTTNELFTVTVPVIVQEVTIDEDISMSLSSN